jgi:hypothetical protein
MKHLKAHRIAIVFTVMMLGSYPAIAATSARIQVTATVLPYVNFNAAQHVLTYHVNSQDLKRGYVDLPKVITVNLKTNIKGGVPVFVDSFCGGRLMIRESGTGNFKENSFTLDTAGFLPNTMISKNYDSRIMLPADAREGVYSFNITMTPAI